MPRAHNTIILNDPDTGRPTAFFYCGLLNALRTAAVSGAMLKAYRAVRPSASCSLGIIGWGPIGRTHLDMAAALLGDRLERVRLYDRRPIDPGTIPPALRAKTEIAEDWRSVYRNSDILATCTVSPDRYIDEPPPPGTLLLNVSLRDYQPESVAGIRAVVVDDWQEICRENTDIERLHLEKGLQPEGALLLEDVLWGNALSRYAPEEPVFFNPMGLAIFDIAIAGFYHEEALRLGRGIELEEPPAP
ncbi:2,3-diaminopropionate biosynthesis protein SbnB [Paenibacillus sp. CC-CFT747]|nr:2,3-diaminopropionate biosynthesis protein SbnB [Paenibacillus sp. CC-CFT747]